MERATRLDHATLLDREIAKPFGLQSLATDDMFAIRPMRSSGYDPASDYRELDPEINGDVVRTDAFNSMFRIPAGGLIATAEDVSAFGFRSIASSPKYGWESRSGQSRSQDTLCNWVSAGHPIHPLCRY